MRAHRQRAFDLNANVFLHVAVVHLKKKKRERKRGGGAREKKPRIEGEVVYGVRSAARETNCLFKKRRRQPPRNECDRSTNLPRKKKYSTAARAEEGDGR